MRSVTKRLLLAVLFATAVGLHGVARAQEEEFKQTTIGMFGEREVSSAAGTYSQTSAGPFGYRTVSASSNRSGGTAGGSSSGGPSGQSASSSGQTGSTLSSSLQNQRGGGTFSRTAGAGGLAGRGGSGVLTQARRGGGQARTAQLGRGGAAGGGGFGRGGFGGGGFGGIGRGGRGGFGGGGFGGGQFGRGGATQGRGTYGTAVRVQYGGPVVANTNASANLQQRLAATPQIQSASGVTVAMSQSRTAVLRGTVASEHDRLLAARMALLNPGISQVQNELSVARPSDSETPSLDQGGAARSTP